MAGIFPIPIGPGSREIGESRFGRIGEKAGICASINRDQDRDRDPGFHFLVVLFGTVVQKCWVPPFGTTSERNLNSLFIMNSAGEEDEDHCMHN